MDVTFPIGSKVRRIESGHGGIYVGDIGTVLAYRDGFRNENVELDIGDPRYSHKVWHLELVVPAGCWVDVFGVTHSNKEATCNSHA